MARRALVALALLAACGAPRPQPAAPPARATREELAPPPLVVDDAARLPERAPTGPARRTLVLQGGHVLWIHDVAVHPDGTLVALLSLDMPDLGQEMTPPTPYSTVSLVEPSTGLTRASWRVPSADLEGRARLHFSSDGALLMLEGQAPRVFDLRDGRVRSMPAIPRAWGVPDPRGEGAFFRTESAIELRRFDGAVTWTRALDGEPPYEGSPLAVHPSGDRVLAVAGSGIHLVSRAGEPLGRAEVSPDVVAFRASGGALYADAEVLHPRTLSPLGAPAWQRVLATTDDGSLVLGPSEEGELALFDAQTGALRAAIERLPEPADAVEESRSAFAFAPGTHRLWACRYVESEVRAAPAAMPIPAGAAPDDVVGFVACVRYGSDGRVARSFTVASPLPIPTGAGPLSLMSEGLRLAIDERERLVMAAMRRVLIVDAEGHLQHAQEDLGLEAMITGAIEANGGLALASNVAVGAFRATGASATLCPGVLDQPPRLRTTPRGPVLYSQRYRCEPARPEPERFDAILGVSHDGRALVVASGDLFDGEGEVALRTARGGRIPLPVEAWCHIDGCGPDAVFTPDDRFVLLDGQLFDTRSGRRVREISHASEPAIAFAPDGRSIARLEETDALALVVEDLRTGRALSRHELERSDEQERPAVVQFVDAARVLVGGDGTIELYTIGAREVTWRRPADRRASMHVLGEHLLVLSDERAILLALSSGDPSGPERRVGPRAVVDAARRRIAWCRGGELRLVDLRDAPERTLGACVGDVLHLGPNFAVSADGSLARVTRLSDGSGLWLRIVIEPGATAFPIIEDDSGRWWTDPAAFARLRLRDAGPLLHASLSIPTERSPGYDPALLTRFFGAASP